MAQFMIEKTEIAAPIVVYPPDVYFIVFTRVRRWKLLPFGRWKTVGMFRTETEAEEQVKRLATYPRIIDRRLFYKDGSEDPSTYGW